MKETDVIDEAQFDQGVDAIDRGIEITNRACRAQEAGDAIEHP